MVLNPNGIEPTFLKFDSWSTGVGFIPIITSNLLNDKGKKRIQERKKQFYAYKKQLTVFKNGFNSTPTLRYHAKGVLILTKNIFISKFKSLLAYFYILW